MEDAWRKYSCESIRTFTVSGVGTIMEFKCYCPTDSRSTQMQVTAPWTNESLWTYIEKTMSRICPAPAAPPPPVIAPMCGRGDVYAPLPFQGCDAGYTRKFDFTKLGYYCYCDAVGAAPPSEPGAGTPPPVEEVPPPVPVTCPRGDIYTKPMFRSCDEGYYQGDLPGAGIPGMGMACICSEGYIPPHVEEDVNGVVIVEEGILTKIIPDIDLSGLSEIFNLLPMIILAAVGIAVLGMFKR